MKNQTPHIGIFGRRNNGKSSLINMLTGQATAIVSEVPGTTTDPVKKSMEIAGLGAAVLIDTAGIDDHGDLGNQRVERSKQSIAQIDLAMLVFIGDEWNVEEENLIKEFQHYKTPFLIVHNKSDIKAIDPKLKQRLTEKYSTNILSISAKNNDGRDLLLNEIKTILSEEKVQSKNLFEGLISPNDLVLLVTPIDAGAPEGRMILPQVQAWRSILDLNAQMISCKPEQLQATLSMLKQPPALVVTDSQVFGRVAEILPKEQALTSFSILMAQMKGDFEKMLEGTPSVKQLKAGDRILILESCTHQISCEDIGRVKIPKLLQKFTGLNLEFDFIAGNSPLPENLPDYKMVIQCGGCVATRKQVLNRIKPFIDKGIPVSNYGMALAFVNGIFERSVKIFAQNKKKS